ncbi:hypothetical protein SAY86_027795 [Trapa natans]|uniref:Fibronectin type III-like domain-containing protein n=1 Tax=Trapa natans TaxID=22666 RepID=A0AAN7KTR4_TRANT|nr:hypothetical protein SAY86_027795 [Trapa natans]
MGVRWSFVIFALLLVTWPAMESAQQKPPYSCGPGTRSLPFCNPDLSIRVRSRDLVSRLTLDEKISQLVNAASAIPRLGIPEFEWWSEGLHGVADVGKGIILQGPIWAATSFPQVILTASTFDPILWYRIGQAIGKEARGIYNTGQAKGMTFWAPNINIFRDPRWGRGQETPGEDPIVTGKYSVSYVRGVQGDTYEGGRDRGHLMASACCKHFTAYDLDNWKTVNRFVFDAKVNAQDMADTYQPPFQKCVVEGKASGIMCAYNKVNGIPGCANYNLLTEVARAQWKFDGYIVSDCDAVSLIYEQQGYALSPEEAVADVLNAGMDVNCGNYLRNYTKSAVEKKKVSVAAIDRALRNLFAVRMRLGLFNGNPKKQPYGNIGPDQVCSDNHQALALEAARNGIVLLKNTAKTLPLRRQTGTFSLAVIGPNADIPKTLLGNYHGPPCKSISPLQALKSYVKDVIFEKGCDSVACGMTSLDKAVEITKHADGVVMFMGLDQSQEREDFDREDLVLPGKQQLLIKAVAQASKKPIVLVLLCGGPVDVSFAKDHPNIGGIIWAGYPGEAGGIAISEVIFGDHNPGGRLPMTWYPQEFTKVTMIDMRMRPDRNTHYPGRTYRFYEGRPVFQYGYGLSYSTYSYKFASVSPQVISLGQSSNPQPPKFNNSVARVTLVQNLSDKLCQNSKSAVTVAVKNHGKMAGKHPILLFLRRAKQGNGRPIKQLVGFQSVELKVDEELEVQFSVNACEHLGWSNEEGLMVIEEGHHYLVVGEEEYPIDIVL